MLKRLFWIGLVVLFVGQGAGVGAAPRSICSLFTAAEVAKLLGTAVEAGEPAAMGTGCQWFGKDEKSYVILQAVEADYWMDPQKAPGYEALKGVGKKAYSHPDSEGGWRAMALTNGAAVTAVAIGATAKRAGTVTLLKQLVERR